MLVVKEEHLHEMPQQSPAVSSFLIWTSLLRVMDGLKLPGQGCD